MEQSKGNAGWSRTERNKKEDIVGETWHFAMDWWNVAIEIGEEKYPEEKRKWSGVVS